MSASGPGWLWSQLRAREAFKRRADIINLNNLLTRIHSWDGPSPSGPQAKLPKRCRAHHSSGFWIDNVTPPVPTFCPSVHPTAFQAEESVLSSCSQWSSALTRCVPASVPPCVLGGQSPGTGSSAPSWGSASPSGSTLITGNTSPDSPLSPAANCTCPQLMLCCGAGKEMQHRPERPQHPSLQPLAFPPPQFRVLGGRTAPAQPTGHLMVIHGCHQPSWLVLCGCSGPQPLSHVRGWCGGMHLQSLYHQRLFLCIFLKESKIFQLQRGDAV